MVAFKQCLGETYRAAILLMQKDPTRPEELTLDGAEKNEVTFVDYNMV